MKKGTVIALLFFAGLFVAAWLRSGQRLERGISRISFFRVEMEALDHLLLSGPHPAELAKKGDKWFTGDGHEADARAVAQLIEGIGQIDSSDLVTRDSARFAELGVDEQGVKVTASSRGKPVAEFTVGKAVATGAHLRVEGGVYRVPGLSPAAFSRPSGQWVRLNPFDTLPDQVTRVDIALSDAAPYALVRQSEKWTLSLPAVLPAGFRFDAAAAGSLVAALVSVRAKDLAPRGEVPDKTGLDQGDTLGFVDQGGQRHELKLGAATEKGDVYLRVTGQPQVYLLSPHVASQLRKRWTDLRDLKVLSLDLGKVKGLSIRDRATALALKKEGEEWKIEKSSEKIPADFQLDREAVERRLRVLSNLRAQGVSKESPPQAGLDRPPAALCVSLLDGQSVCLLLGRETKEGESEGVAAQGNVDDAVYLLPKGTKTFLTGGWKSLKKSDAPPQMPQISPEALSKLPPELRQSLMKQLKERQVQQQLLQAVQAKPQK